jgi:nucleoside-diphosphate-sugar epimerase
MATTRYLVTGGAGFIGSHIVAELVRQGAVVRVADNFSTGRRENLAPFGPLDLVEGDLADPAVAREAVAGCTHVIHQAAIPSVPRSVSDPVGTHRANVDATLQVLVAARAAGVRRVVFAGSSSVYGNAVELPKREDMKPAPLSPYALQKLVGEEYCRLFHHLYGLETVTTRYFNVYGPRQQPGSPYSGVISLFVEALCSGRAPHMHGDGGQTRDFTFVSDVVTGVLKACHASGAAGRVMNLAGGGRVSLLDLVATLQRLLGSSLQPTFGPPREGDVRDSQADVTLARKVLGFVPATPLEEGLRQTVAWYQQAAAIAAHVESK